MIVVHGSIHVSFPVEYRLEDIGDILSFEWFTSIPYSQNFCVYLAFSGDIDVDNQQEIVVVWGDKVLCIDGRSGIIEWNTTINLTYSYFNRDTEIHILTQPEFHQMIMADQRNIYSINTLQGEILWNITMREKILMIDTLNQSIIVVTNSSIACVENGKILWTKNFEKPIVAIVSSANNVVIVHDGERILMLNPKGDILREHYIGVRCSEWPPNPLLLEDIDMDERLEVVIPLANNTIIIFELDTLDVEYKFVLPKTLYWYAVGTLNKNNIPDMVFVLSGTENGYTNVVAEILILFDFSITHIIDPQLFFPEANTEIYLLIWDIDCDGQGDIILGSSFYQEICIILNLEVRIIEKFHGWDMLVHFLDKVYVIDVSGDLSPDIILSEHGPEGIRFINRTYLSKNHSICSTKMANKIDPPIIIDDIDKDGILEIVGIYYGASTNNITGVIVYEMKNARDIYALGTPKEIFIQKKFDHDLDYLTDNIERRIGTELDIWDTDKDELPDGWEYMNNLDPLGPQDATLDNDNDGLNNIAEYRYGGDPWDSDTDDDGFSDYDEAQIGTDLRLNDTDGDGYSDGYEVSHGTDPLDPDDYPVPLIVRYWWVPVACVAVIVVFVVFFYRRGVLVGRHDGRL